MNKPIGISTFNLQRLYGDIRAIEIAKEIGADAIDFSLEGNSLLDKSSIYSKSEEEITSYYKKVRQRADELGIKICQTHGRLRVYFNDKIKDEAVFKDGRTDCKFSAHLTQ